VTQRDIPNSHFMPLAAPIGRTVDADERFDILSQRVAFVSAIVGADMDSGRTRTLTRWPDNEQNQCDRPNRRRQTHSK
jgi:hypothetical protein